jgi:MFS family permease
MPDHLGLAVRKAVMMTEETEVVKEAVPLSESDASPSLLETQPKQNVWRVGSLTYTRGGLAALFGWLLWGDFAWSMKERAVGPVFQLLLTKCGASNTTMAVLLVVLPSAIGLFLQPIISFRSDRYRSNMGRRIPFMLIVTPIAAVAMAAIAFSPMLGEATHKALGLRSLGLNSSILLYYGLFWVVFEIATIVANSVFGAFLNDVVPSSLLGRFFGLFRAMSLLAGMIFNFWLIKKAEDHSVWLFAGISLLYGVGFTAMCLRVKEGRYPPLEISAAQRRRSLRDRFMEAAKVYFRECYSNPYYVWVFLASIISVLSFMPVNLYSIPYAKSLNISMEVYGEYVALTYAISLVLTYVLGSLADRFHPLRIGMVALFVYGVTCLCGGFVATSARPFAITFVLHGVLSGTFFTATASLGQRLLPHEKFAQFSSASAILGCLINMVATFAFGRFLDLSGSVYRYTFLTGAIVAFISLVLLYIVYRQFNKFGGLQHYRAPA